MHDAGVEAAGIACLGEQLLRLLRVVNRVGGCQ